jgi:hypothetical protein
MNQALYNYALSRDFITGKNGGFQGNGGSMDGCQIKELLANSIRSVLDGTSEHEVSRPYYKSLLAACGDATTIDHIAQYHQHRFENQWAF